MTYWDAIVQVLSAIVGPATVLIALWALLAPIVMLVLFISLIVLIQANWLAPSSGVPGSADW